MVDLHRRTDYREIYAVDILTSTTFLLLLPVVRGISIFLAPLIVRCSSESVYRATLLA